MPEAGTDPKPSNPKIRRPKSTDDSLPRQVHFDQPKTKTKTPPPGLAEPNTQPDSHPQVGLPHLNRPPSGQWYTAADPTRSVHCQPAFTNPAVPPGVAAATHFHPFPNSLHHHQQHIIPGPTYFGLPTMDYQNCVPPPTGVNFQPPVPDTTFGPIPHVYMPRFDGPVQVGVPFSFVPSSLSPAAVAQPAVGPMPVQNTYAVPQPSYVPVTHGQPVMFNGQAYVPAQGIPGQPMMANPPMMAAPGMAAMPAGQPVPMVPGNPNSSNIPDVSGLGKTQNEETLRQVEFAYNNRLFEPQDFKPADDDPSRFYYVREVDGNWTQRNRFTIDHMGDCRWYVTDEGWFYAVRLPD
ncbi:hypothetical protein QQS21_009789 [Conoideocrella luteorostrata]|uniref:Uncharacterized protein n=1 Tax=Conoideocrella luteorostrata TaxID=1105319 RepID=A0AAJ0FUS6_9HYPO|nr:hypothetical protein QQS21_009789 [Conoideocrella luteorostrata]